MLGKYKRSMGKTFPHCYDGTACTDDIASAITLKRNSQFFVRHGDVEHLIAQGYLQRLP